MLLDYTRQEKSKLESIEKQYKPAFNKAFETFNQVQDEFNKLDKDAENKNEIAAKLKKARDEYLTALKEYETKRAPIIRRAEKRELKYFVTHTDELAELLQPEIDLQIIGFALLINSNSHVKIKERLTDTLKQYFDILEKYDSERYKLVTDFMENTISDRANLMAVDKKRLVGILQDLMTVKKIKHTRRVSYMPMLQDKVTNAFQRVSRLDNDHGLLAPWCNQATFIQGNLTLSMSNYELYRKTMKNGKGIYKEKNSGEIPNPVKGLFDIALITFTNNGHDPTIRFPLDEYMRRCGLSSKDKARKQVNLVLDMLFDIKVTYTDSKGKGYLDLRIVDAKGIKNSIVYLHFTPAYVKMLETDAQHSVMPFALEILKASTGNENPNAYTIARKILEHRYMNAGKVNERRISIKTLLESAQYLASEKQVRETGRHFTERIIKPFIGDLENACYWLGIGYELHYTNKEKIPDNELENLKYETFIKAHVWFDELPDYPNQDARLEKKKEHEQKALAAQNEKLKEKDNE